MYVRGKKTSKCKKIEGKSIGVVFNNDRQLFVRRGKDSDKNNYRWLKRTFSRLKITKIFFIKAAYEEFGREIAIVRISNECQALLIQEC